MADDICNTNDFWHKAEEYSVNYIVIPMIVVLVIYSVYASL